MGIFYALSQFRNPGFMSLERKVRSIQHDESGGKRKKASTRDFSHSVRPQLASKVRTSATAGVCDIMTRNTLFQYQAEEVASFAVAIRDVEVLLHKGGYRFLKKISF